MRPAIRRPALLLALLLVALAASLPWQLGSRASAKAEPGAAPVIPGVPHVKQKPDFCGEACLAMALKKLGRDVSQDDVFDQAGVDPLLGRGAYTAELVRAAQAYGFRTGPVWTKVPAGATAAVEAQLHELARDLARGVPSIVCMRYDTSRDAPEHFRLILGIDARTGAIIYHEPAEARGAYRQMKRADFLAAWPLRADARSWSVIRIRLEQGEVRTPRRLGAHGPAAYAQHVMELRKKLPAGFTALRSPPFLVLGDEPAATVRQRTESTVQWTVAQLKREYFSRDPDHIIDVWLFKDRASYGTHAWRLFRDRPSTPYGYYSAQNRALVMNISTGGGTLVHEIVHPFMRANFPACPAWLNEGLGSLYEQCAERDGRIWGRPNWRLPGLQAAIRAGTVPSFARLTGTSDREFYDEDPGTNYAQARYLAMYLQERGLLRAFYHRFAASQKSDPTGRRTLMEVLGERDLEAFKRRWEAWVMTLRFEG
ncbi:MAG TPA: C39 family peptidase [Polyangia bacterium]